jgi:hypothetical protein
MNQNVFGIKTLKINHYSVFTINVKINSNTFILDKVKSDCFWNKHHYLSEKNGKQRIHFIFTTLKHDEIQTAKEALLKLLFTHKVINLYNSSYFTQDKKESIIVETITQLKLNF